MSKPWWTLLKPSVRSASAKEAVPVRTAPRQRIGAALVEGAGTNDTEMGLITSSLCDKFIGSVKDAVGDVDLGGVVDESDVDVEGHDIVSTH